jgi:hypothetical protein
VPTHASTEFGFHRPTRIVQQSVEALQRVARRSQSRGHERELAHIIPNRTHAFSVSAKPSDRMCP